MALQVHTHTKTKDAPANPWGKVLKVSFKAALSGLPKKEKERGGRRGKETVCYWKSLSSLPLLFTPFN